MGIPNTGNGRRESYQHIPMPRMTNTYMLAGAGCTRRHHRVGEVRRLCGELRWRPGGYYQRQVCVFCLRGLPDRGWQDHRAAKNATLIGNGPDVLTKVSMVGSDLKLDEGVGTCGKDGQSVPVGVGIPTLKVDRLTVGGTGG